KMLKISSNPLDCSTFEMELQALPFLENIFVGPDQKLLDIVGRTLNTYITDEKTLGYMFLLEFWKGRKEILLEEASIRERNDDLEGSLLILENPCDFDLSESEIDLKIKELKKRIAEKEYFKALKYEEDGELEKALIAYKTSLKHGLHDPNIYYNMSYLLIDNNDYKGAVDSLTKYVALVPSDKEARKKLESLKHVFRGLKS
ncbi:MAG: tetratricopeptide repeat protein, partial [Candidatus Hodarchaeota archaeon]